MNFSANEKSSVIDRSEIFNEPYFSTILVVCQNVTPTLIENGRLGDWSPEKDRTVVGDWRFDNLCVSNLQSQDSEDGFRTGCRKWRQSPTTVLTFSGLQSPRWSLSIKECYSWVQTIFLYIRYVTTDDHYKIFVQEQTRLVVFLPDKVNTQLSLFIYSRTEKQNEGMKN